MRRLVLVALVACGGAAVPPSPSPPAASVPVVDASAPTAAPDAAVGVTTPDAAVSPSLKVTLLGEVSVSGKAVVGPGFTPDGTRVGVVVGGSLRMFDATTLAPVTGLKGGTVARATGPMLIVDGYAFDPSTGAELVVPTPKPFQCEGTSFSQDASRMAAYCWAAGRDGVVVMDTHTGAQIGVFREFQTAAPIRVGSITPSGNFIFWLSRASGAFEEIKSHVTGPVISSHSVMSPDERFLFTAPDRNWYTEAVPTGQLVDAKNGRTVMTIAGDVESGTFSPSSRMLAVFRERRTDTGVVRKPWSLHSVDHDDVLGSLPADLITVAFSPDDTRIAGLTEGGTLRVYKLERP